MKKIFLNYILPTLLIIFIQTGCAFADFSIREMELNFVQISDTHISDKADTSYKALSSSKELLKDAILQTNMLKPVDFVMFTGDMVNEPLKDSYRDFFIELTKLKYPALMAFGNHDMLQLQERSEDTPPYLTKDEAISVIKACNPFYIFDKSYYAFSPKRDYRVIVLDTTIDDKITSNGYLTDEMAGFLKYEIETHKDKVIIIFEHHPLVEPFKSEHHKIINSETYMDILKQYKRTPIAIFSGHYHAAKITRQGNILHISTPSLVTYPNAFRYVNITNYNDRTIFNIKYYETNLTDIQKQSRIGAIASAALRGMPSDHNTEIVIRKKDNNNDYKEEKPKTTKEDKQIQKELKKAQKELKKQEKMQEKLNKKAQKQQAKQIKNNAKNPVQETIETPQEQSDFAPLQK